MPEQNTKILDSEGNTIDWFGIEELIALSRVFQNQWLPHDDEEAVKVINKIFHLISEYKGKNGMA